MREGKVLIMGEGQHTVQPRLSRQLPPDCTTNVRSKDTHNADPSGLGHAGFIFRSDAERPAPSSALTRLFRLYVGLTNSAMASKIARGSCGL